jgi:LPXTG-motif cell wall-anchored protein
VDPTDPTDPTPVDESELEGAPTGGVSVNPSTASAGDRVVVTVGTAHAGEQVRVWLHSTPVLLGTFTVNAAGTVTVTLPQSVAAGSHRIVVQALDGSLIGWAALEVTALAATGADVGRNVALAAALLLLGGLGVVVARSRRRVPVAD